MRLLVLSFMFLLSMCIVHAHAGHGPEIPHDAPLPLENEVNTTAPANCFPLDAVGGGKSTALALSLALGLACLALGSYKNSTLFYGGAAIFLGFFLGYSFVLAEINSQSLHFGLPGSAHRHADFAVMIDNQLVAFTDEYYLSTATEQKSLYVHLHDLDSVVHVHATGVTWKYFFESINVTMNPYCLDVRGTPVCNATFVRNGVVEALLLSEEIQEGDRALFHFGQGNATNFYFQAVGTNSCLHSGTCPERGFLPGCSSTPTS